MESSFVQFLKSGKAFKLILGAGNQNISEIEKIVAIYAKAGCKFFDVGASVEAVEAAKRGIIFAIPEKFRNDHHICVSVGTKNDPHLKKCIVDKNICVGCGSCLGVCRNSAIYLENSKAHIKSENCIGCLGCFNVCSKHAIDTYSVDINLKNVLPDIISKGIKCIEFHINLSDKNEVFEKLEQINSVYSGILSVSIGRTVGSETDIKEVLNKIIKTREPYTTIIQADGVPISGGKDDFASNLQALAMVDFVNRQAYQSFVFASGGVNTKFAQLANQFELPLTGVAMGSFARKAIERYYKQPDILTNTMLFNDAVNVAKGVVNSALGLKG